ncbi:MAG: hypothetical protein AB7F99_17690, partial [Vicinamibacterales bacterium]
MFRRSESSPAIDPPAPRFSRGLSITGFAVLLLIGLLAVVFAQSRSTAGGDSAEQALNEGRYDEVAELTAGLAPTDPTGVVLRARADIARGRYQEAEQALRPIAQQDPEGDAALELGLLLHYLRREEARPILDDVASGISSARDAADLVRAGRALQALNLPRDADSAFREAAAASPGNPEVETAWGNLFLERHNNADAVKSFQAALESTKWAPALLGMARAL